MTVTGRWIGAVSQRALRFLTRLPIGYRDGDWDAFRATPAAFPIAGLVAGALAAIPLYLLQAHSQRRPSRWDTCCRCTP